jgi:hypothetical protein
MPMIGFWRARVTLVVAVFAPRFEFLKNAFLVEPIAPIVAVFLGGVGFKTSRKFGASRSGNSLLRPLAIGDFVTGLAKHL